MSNELLDIRMKDGSRHFCVLPESISFAQLKVHAAKLQDAKIRDFLTDSVTEIWLDFDFRNERFSINNQFGEYWFFVNNPDCPDATLSQVRRHFENLLEK